jgi:hypothetical protein
MVKARTSANICLPSANICLPRRSHGLLKCCTRTVQKTLKTSEADYASEMRCNDKEHERGRLSARMDPLCAAGAMDSDLSHKGDEITR